MGFKKYFIFAVLFLGAIGGYIYSFQPGNYTWVVPKLGIPITLPIAVWIILPGLLLFLFTILHFMFYGTKGYLKAKAIKSDAEKFYNAAKNALLGKNSEAFYKTEPFKLPGLILSIINYAPKKLKNRIHNDEILDILEVKERVNNGEYVDLSKYGLQNDNPLYIKNLSNKLDEDKMYAESILKRCDDKELCKKAFLIFATYAKKSDLLRYNNEMTREVFDILIDRINSSKYPYDMTDEEIIQYAKDLNFDSKDYIDLAKKLMSKINPDRLIMLFEKMSNEVPNTAIEAYLYILFELQMINNAREVLENTEEHELMKFKYMLFLKDEGKNFDTELFI